MATKVRLEEWEEKLAREGAAIRRMREMDAGAIGNVRGARQLRCKRTMRTSYVATPAAKQLVGNWK